MTHPYFKLRWLPPTLCGERDRQQSLFILFAKKTVPPPLQQTASELWCLYGGKRGDYQNCSVLYCVLKLRTVISTLRWAVLTVLWIGLCHTGPISLCVDLFVFVCFILHTLCSKKCDAKIQITITMAHFTRINYPLSSFNYRLSGTKVANFNKIRHIVFEQQLIKKWNSKTEVSNMENTD